MGGAKFRTIDILPNNITIQFMIDMSNVKVDRVAAPVRRQVEDAIRNAIVDGRLKPGARIIEARLCEQLDVSRTILREALRQIEAEGLIFITPYRGARVASVTTDEVRQLYEVRAQLEGLAGRDFARHATSNAFNELNTAFKALQNIADNGSNGRSFLEAKERFYAVLLSNCSNKFVRKSLEQLNNKISQLRAISMSRDGRASQAVGEIHKLIIAIEKRDPDAAYKACLYHVEQAARSALLALQESSSVDDDPQSTSGSTLGAGSYNDVKVKET